MGGCVQSRKNDTDVLSREEICVLAGVVKMAWDVLRGYFAPWMVCLDTNLYFHQ